MIRPREQSERASKYSLLRWLAAVLVLAVLFHFLPLEPLRAAIAKVPRARFLVVLVLYLGAHGIGVLKWRMVVNAAGARLDLSTSAQCYLGGLFGTLFLPSIVGGDVVRLAVGLRRSPRPAAVLAGNLADRSLDILAQLALVLAGLVLLPGAISAELAPSIRRALWTLAAFAAISLLLVLLLYKRVVRGRSVRFRRKLGRFRQALRAVRGRPHVLAFAWILGTFIQFCFVFLTALLAISCGLVLPLRVWLFAWPLAKIAALLPLTQGGIGLREAALVVLLLPFDAPAPLTLASGLVWEGVIIAGGLIAGLSAWLLRRSAPAAPAG